MKPTDKTRVLYKVALLLVLSILYVTLVAGDYLIAKVISVQQDSSPAEKIISTRKNQEDIPQIARAIQDGYSPIFIPESLDNLDSPFRALAEKYSVAPLAAQPNTDVFFCNEGYGLLKYRTDKFGFRNSPSVYKNPPDIVLIGDSFVHGACVEHTDTIAAQLEKSFNVVNLATGGNHPIHYAALTKIFLPRLIPKYAVIVFYANDNGVFKDLHSSYHYKYYFLEDRPFFEEKLSISNNLERFYKEANSLMLKNYNERGERLYPSFFQRGPIVDRAIKYLSLSHIRKLIRDLVSRDVAYNLSATKFEEDELDSASKFAIDFLASQCEILGCRGLIIFIPNSPFWMPDPRAQRYEMAIEKRARALRLTYWSAGNELSRITNNEAFALKGGHLSPLGNAVVARGIEKLIYSD